jgi:hypothetical protein
MAREREWAALRAVLRWSWILPLGIAGAAACGGAAHNEFNQDSGPGEGDAGGGADVGLGEGYGHLGDAYGSGDCSTTHCSADLHQVLDCNDNVLRTCPPNQGCGNGACVPACASAQANQTAIGCDFYMQNLPPADTGAGSCYAVLVANTWNAPITVGIEYAGAPLTGDFVRRAGANGNLSVLQNGQLNPNELGIVFLSAYSYPYGGTPDFWIGCPTGVTPAYTASVGNLDGTGIGNAFHVTTSAPVVAYDTFPYGGSKSYITSSSLLLPTSAWGTNYVAADGYKAASSVLEPYLQIGAAQDGTHVTINPTADILPYNGVAAATQGMPQTYTLNKGQYIQFEQATELAGSAISSDKPVSVVGGASGTNIPLGVTYSDSLHQQLVPVNMLGHTYTAVRYRDRQGTLRSEAEQVPWRLVGAVNGTTLQYDPPQAGAPTTLAQGQLVEFEATGPFTVSSQDDKHPFYTSAHMTGGSGYGDLGDPDYVNIVTPDAWLSSYLFLSDPSYNYTTLVFVRGKAPDGTFKDVTLDCAGPLTGWQPIGSGGTYEYTRADLVLAGAPQGKCTNGVHTATSAAPFALTVWGFDAGDVSYAFPAGMGTQPINSVVVSTNPAQ